MPEHPDTISPGQPEPLLPDDSSPLPEAHKLEAEQPNSHDITVVTQDKHCTIIQGDCIAGLKSLPEESVQCCVSSPPYWNLRDYAVAGQVGLEDTPEHYVSKMVEVFREVRRVLRKDGCLWLNLGDCYAAARSYQVADNKNPAVGAFRHNGRATPPTGLKQKDMVGIPWAVAFALRSDGWYLRCDVIWSKPNPLPESVTDRPTKSHEYIFLLTKSQTYFYDAEAIKETCSPNTHLRVSQATLDQQQGGFKQDQYEQGFPGKKSRDRRPNEILKAMGRKAGLNPKAMLNAEGSRQNESFSGSIINPVLSRNKRSVWEVTTKPFLDAHFATYPCDLISPCIKAGTSAYGCCAKCGAPWERVMHVTGEASSGGSTHKHAAIRKGQGETGTLVTGNWATTTTTGWQPTCECHGKFKRGKVIIPARLTKEQVQDWGADANGEYHGTSQKGHPEDTGLIQNASAVKARIIDNATKDREVIDWIYHPEIPIEDHPVDRCVVLDPFAGSGTTGQVAIELGRKAVMIELNPQYIQFIKQRCAVTPGLPLA